MCQDVIQADKKQLVGHQAIQMKYNDSEVVAAGLDNKLHKNNGVYLSFVWDIINICNYKCSYCSAGYGNDETRPVSTFFKNKTEQDIWRLVLLRLRMLKEHEWEISLLGGEPTLHPNLREIIDNLTKLEACRSIYIITNMAKTLKYFLDLVDGVDDKLILNPSIHFEYYKPSVMDKTLELITQTNTNIQPTVMLHDNPKYWTMMSEYLDMCVENGVEYNSTFLEAAHDYEPKYTDEFFEQFSKYIQHGRGVDDVKYNIETADGNEHEVTVEDIYKYNIKQFKGWQCTPKSWKISCGGGFENSCTKQKMSVTGDNLICKTACPNTTCGCNEWWMYRKERM